MLSDSNLLYFSWLCCHNYLFCSENCDYMRVYRYEVRVEACTALGCSSSDWSSVLTLEAPPAGQTASLLDLQPDQHTGLQTTFFLTWSPPAQPNGRVLHYAVYRRVDHTTDAQGSNAETLIYRNVSTSCKDEGLQPYTVYHYQVWCSARLHTCVFITATITNVFI